MSSLVDYIKNYPDALCGKAGNEEDIKEAEATLNLSFSNEYRAYLRAITSAALDGRELTGICKSKRLNVTDATLKQRKLNPDIPDTMYVVEETNIDGIVIWQDNTGTVYQTAPGIRLTKIANSIKDYLNL